MIDTPLTPDLVRGIAELEPTAHGVTLHRLPAWARRQFPDPQLIEVERQPSGARIVVRTSAQRIELVSHPTRRAFRGTERARGRIDVRVDGAAWSSAPLADGDFLEIDLQTGGVQATQGADHVTTIDRLPAGDKLVEIWLPHNEALGLVALRSDAPLRGAPHEAPVWLHHGSSISQGSNAVSPTEIWPVVAARRAGVELQNLGVGGSAIVDPFMARVMRDAEADLISVKLGINVVNSDAMRLRAFVPAVHGFLDTIRDGHPDTPLLLVSPLYCGIHEDTPGPGAIDPTSIGTDTIRFIATGTPGDTAQGRLTLRVIRTALREIAAQRADDPHLHYLEGTELYGEQDAAELPLPDDLHPSSAAHARIGERFADLAWAPGGAFAGVPARAPIDNA